MNLPRIRSVFVSLDNPKVFSMIAFAVIIFAIPLTIYLARTQQEVRQRAEGNSCPVGTKYGTGTFYCSSDCSGDRNATEYTCSDSTQRCCFGINPPTPTPSPTASPAPTATLPPTVTTSPIPTATPTPIACAGGKADIMIVIDLPIFSVINPQPRQRAIDLAKEIVNTVKTDNKGNKIGFIYGNTLSGFSQGGQNDGATVGSEFTDSYDIVTAAIETFKTQSFFNGGCIECSLKKANQKIQENGNNGAKEIIALITEGTANYYLGTQDWGRGSTTYPVFDYVGDTAKTKAGEAATNGKISGTLIYTLSLGNDTTKQFLTNVATSGKYFESSGINIPGVYNDMTGGSGGIAKSISGFVFNDANGNGTFDSNEQKLPDWTINLSFANAIMKSDTTDSSGNFVIDGICTNGNYILSEQVKEGFTQTVPVNPNNYPISITNSSSNEVNKIFGNKRIPIITCTPKPSCVDTPPFCLRPVPIGGWCVEPTPTDGTGRTTLDLEFKLMGIGKDKSRSENDNPKTDVRDVEVEVFKSTDSEPLSTESAEITYNPATGTFKGLLDLDEVIENTGNYAFTAKVSRYIRKIIGKDTNQIIQYLVKGTRKLAPLTPLIVGDMNDDNIINIEDWNIWSACLNKTITTPVPLDGIDANCDIADLNDDGEVDSNKGEKINMEDYKWLFNSFQIQRGD